MNYLSLIHISEPTRQAEISYAVFCLKKKKKKLAKKKKRRGVEEQCQHRVTPNCVRKQVRQRSLRATGT